MILKHLRFLKRPIIVTLMICVGFIPSNTAQANVEETDTNSKELTAVMGEKLQRGATNLALGWTEISKGIDEIGEKHGVGAAATWGVLHGTGRAIQRTAFGIFEILTFPLDFSVMDNLFQSQPNNNIE